MRTINFSGLPLTLTSQQAAVDSMIRVLRRPPSSGSCWICFLNSHNFNQARSNFCCSQTFHSALAVFPDGIALRLAARLTGTQIETNLPGTDLVPALMASGDPGRFKCFLFGDTRENVVKAAREVGRRYAGWEVVGAAPGYYRPDEESMIVDEINASKPDLLLLGMGTPRQELFIQRQHGQLAVPLIICAGGLFSYWCNRLVRAPRTFRKLNIEWLWICLQQPHKWHRYSIGMLQFFHTVLREQAPVAYTESQT